MRRTGKLDKAAELAAKAAQLSERTSNGPISIDIAVGCANLGVLRREQVADSNTVQSRALTTGGQGRPAEALELYSKAAIMHKQLHTGNSLEMAVLLQNQVS